jgi:flavin-dependent dehydrogenase
MIVDVDVIVVGAGPAGLLVAGDLARAGVSCAVLERRLRRSGLTRSFTVHARTLEELLEDRARQAGAEVRYGSEVTGLTQHPDAVEVKVRQEATRTG